MLEDRVFAIAGATGGLGKAAAHAFAAQGASLALVSSDRGKLGALAMDLGLPDTRLLAHAADLLDPQAARGAATAVLEKFGRLDGLVHLVGGWTGGKTLAESSPEDLRFMLDRHVWSTYYLVQAFLPAMQRGGWGRVLTVSSPFATQPTAKMGPYAAGKAAQETLLLALADEFADSGLTANILQVRSIDLEGAGKGTTPEEITAAMLYLCSDQAARINGARIPLY